MKTVSVAAVEGSFVFFFNDTATTEIYTLSLHDALPISPALEAPRAGARLEILDVAEDHGHECGRADRKSTRLNSSHANISYAVFCLKKKQSLRHPVGDVAAVLARLYPVGVTLHDSGRRV